MQNFKRILLMDNIDIKDINYYLLTNELTNEQLDLLNEQVDLLKELASYASSRTSIIEILKAYDGDKKI
jgi:hypothetical protein